MRPIHPGEVLRADFLEPLGLTHHQVAASIGVPSDSMGEILNGERAITANTASGLSHYFETSESFWMNLQSHYELEISRDQIGHV